MLVEDTKTNRLIEVIRKIDNGSGITDEELSIGIQFYDDLESKLRLLGPRHHFSWADARTKLDILKGFREARSRH